MSNSRYSRHGGFTLIELLVVIVIIGILAGISVGTFQGRFASARDAERQAAVQGMANVVKITQVTRDTIDYEKPDGTNNVATAAAGAVAASLSTVLDNEGIIAPTVKQKRCYYYGYHKNNKDQFFIAVYNEDTDANGGITVAGTAAGIAAAEGVAATDFYDATACPVSPTVVNYTVVIAVNE